MSDSTIADVSDTSYWVAHYRAVETERPDALFKDPLARKLVGDRGKKIADTMAKIGRYTQWSVVSRTVIIDGFIHELIREGVDTVLNLGAGLDTRPYRMDLPASLNWIEVDYPQIIARKTQVLADDVPKCRLTRVAVDLANDVERRKLLSEVAPDARKVLVITEGVIPYLTPGQVANLAADLSAQKRIAYWVGEYFHPRVYPHLKASLRARQMRNAPFRFYPDDWFGFFAKQGWVKKAIGYSGDVAAKYGRRPPMPWFAVLLLPFMPAKLKEQMGQMTGYVVYQKGETR